jgi:cbb3-type cytochrome c oxidase subunit III
MRPSIVRMVAAAAFACAVPVAAQNLANGEALYQSICRVCHGFPPAGGPERAAGNPTLITNAINGRVPTMGFLREVLDAVDIADIAAYLLTLSNPNPQPAVPAFDYSDLWWNPSESGWGLNLVQHASNVIFGVMYTYEAPNRATWFVIPGGSWTTATVYSGAIYRVSGPAFNAQGFSASSVRVQQVGLATLTFIDRDNATFAFTIDGVPVMKSITRQPF